MASESKKDITKMATIYAQEGKWDKAISEYKKLLTLDPTDFNVHNMLGDAYVKKKDDALAYQEYIAAAEAYTKQGLADKANIIYKKIGRLESEKLPDKDRQKQVLIKKHTMAEKFIEAGEIDKAIETYKEIIKLSPANFETHQKLGELYAEKGDKESAQEYYKKIVDIYFKNRLYKKALPIYQKILEIHPEDITAHEKIAEIYEREANESDAKREFLFLAEYYWKEKNIEKTDFFAQKAVEFKSIEAHFFKGAALYERKEAGEAKKELEMLLKFKANHGAALTIMGMIYRDTGQIDEAISTFDKVVKAEPENTDALEALADLYSKKGNNKESAAKLLMAVSIFNGKHNYDRAAQILNKAALQEPENIEILSKLGETFSKQNKKKEAADVFIRISELYKKEKMEDKATEYYRMAQEMDPANPKIVDRAKRMAVEPPPSPKAQPAPPPPKTETKQQAQPAMPDMQAINPQPLKIQHTSMAQAAAKQAPPPPPQKAAPPAKKEEPSAIEALPEIDIFGVGGKKPSEKITDMEKEMAPQQKMFVPQQPMDDDIPALIAMGDGYIKSGSFDEAIEMYQRALAMDPNNQTIKKKLNAVYSQYAGVPVVSPAEAEYKRRDEEDKKKRAEAIKKEEAEREKRKKEDDARRKKEEEENKKKKETDEKKKKEDDEARRKKEEEERKKRDKEEEEKRKREADAKKKKEEEEKKKKPEPVQEESVDEELSDDFVTVTTAEIFIKQGLFTEAEKILTKILKKDAANIEAKMKLDELKKLQTETEQKGENIMDEAAPKGKQSKVTYI